MVDVPKYVWGDLPADEEYVRQSVQASLFLDPMKARLLRLGLGPGSRCLEIGPGSGDLLRWLVEQGGSVTAFDISDRWFDAFRNEQVDARVGDARTVDLGSGYDFAVTSNVLHHLPERVEVVRRMMGALKPGGWLVASEPDFSVTWTASGPDEVASAVSLITSRFSEMQVDFQWGTRMPSVFQEVGLQNVDAGVWAPLHAPGCGGAKIFDINWATLRQVSGSQGWLSEAELQSVESAARSLDLVAASAPVVLCWGQKPSSSS